MPKRKKTIKKTSKKATKAKSVPKSGSVKALYNSDVFYCQLNVSNYDRSLKFYKEIMELEPTDFSKSITDPSSIGWYEFHLPVKGSVLGLGLAENVKVSHSVCISVSNLDDMKSSFETKGEKPNNITDIPNMISFFTLNDPDNNPIMFISEPRIKE